MAGHELGQQEGSGEIDLDHGAPVVGGEADERAEAHDAGVVHEHVRPTTGIERLLDRRSVGDRRDDRIAVDLARDLLGAAAVEVEHTHAVAALRGRPRDARANPSRAAGDEERTLHATDTTAGGATAGQSVPDACSWVNTTDDQFATLPPGNGAWTGHGRSRSTGLPRAMTCRKRRRSLSKRMSVSGSPSTTSRSALLPTSSVPSSFSMRIAHAPFFVQHVIASSGDKPSSFTSTCISRPCQCP